MRKPRSILLAITQGTGAVARLLAPVRVQARAPPRFHNLVGVHSIVIRMVHDEAYAHVSVQHFHAEIRHGDSLRWNTRPWDVDSIRTYLVLTNIPHPEGVRGVWWAELVVIAMPVVVLGRAYIPRSWRLLDNNRHAAG